MATAPDLSVIIVTHNRADLAVTTIKSAAAAATGLRVQWVIVDSGSSDGTPEAIEREFADIKVLRHGNVGFAGANNIGLRNAVGRYVLLLNPDVEILTGRFLQLVQTLDGRPEVGLASVIQRSPEGPLQHSIRRLPGPRLAWGEALGLFHVPGLAWWRQEVICPGDYRREREADWLVGAFLLARRSAAREVGPLDERFFLYSEEVDWCHRFGRAGWEVRHIPLMAIVHHTGDYARPDLAAQLSHSKVLFARKHFPRGKQLNMRLALMFRHAIRAVALAPVSAVRPRLRARVRAEARALAVVGGMRPPPFAEA